MTSERERERENECRVYNIVSNGLEVAADWERLFDEYKENNRRKERINWGFDICSFIDFEMM